MALGTDELAKLIIRIRADTKELKGNLEQGKSSISKFASNAKQILAGIGISIGTAVLLRELKQILEYFIEYNSQIEQSVLGISSLINASSDISDETGKILQGQEKFNAALKIGEGLYKQIQTAALKTAATSQEIVIGFQSMLAPARAANLSLEQTMNLSIAIVQAMQAMNLPMIQMRLEARALLNGEENMRADLMKNLGIRGEIVRQMREQGKLYDYLMEKLSAFTQAGEAQLGTWKGLKSSIKDMVSILGAMATKDFFAFLTEQLKQFLAKLGEVRNGVFTFSEEAIEKANMLKNTLASIIEHFNVYGTLYKNLIGLLGGLLRYFAASISLILTGLSTLWLAVSEAIYETINIFNLITLKKIPQLNEALKNLGEHQKNVWQSIKEQAMATFDIILGRAKGEEAEIKLNWKVSPLPTTGDLGETDKAKAKERESILERLRSKIRSLQLEYIALTDPVRAAEMALEDFIQQTTSGHPEKFAATVNQLREAYKRLYEEQQKRALAGVESEEQLSQAMIKVKDAMQQVEQAYETGLVSISEYYNRKRQLTEESYQAEIDALKRQIEASNDLVEQRKLTIQVTEKEAESRREIIKLNHEEAQSTRDLLKEIEDLRNVKSRGFTRDTESITARYDDELLALEERYALVIEKVKALDNEKLAAIEEGLTKEQLLKDLMAAKDIQRAELVAKKELAIRQAHYRTMSDLYGGMSDIMGSLYEASGRETKTFFEMQKQFAIAEAFINAHLAATKAMSQGGIWGTLQAAAIYAKAIAHAMAIAQQKPAGYAKGGLIMQGSGAKDDTTIRVTRREFIQPVETVKYYGEGVMEALRKRLIPRSLFSGFGFMTPSIVAGAAAGGGLVGDTVTKNLAINTSVTLDDSRLANDLKRGIEKTIINIMRGYSR